MQLASKKQYCLQISIRNSYCSSDAVITVHTVMASGDWKLQYLNRFLNPDMHITEGKWTGNRECNIVCTLSNNVTLRPNLQQIGQDPYFTEVFKHFMSVCAFSTWIRLTVLLIAREILGFTSYVRKTDAHKYTVKKNTYKMSLVLFSRLSWPTP